MMKRQLLPSVVVTFSALAGCSTQAPGVAEPDATTAGAPEVNPTVSVEPASTTSPSAPTSATGRRTVKNTELPTLPLPAGADVRHATLINPNDAQGRMILAAGDGTCYVQAPRTEPLPAGPTGRQNVDNQVVACPPTMLDAAWDNCTGGRLLALAAGVCACAVNYGNPPPPPRDAECVGWPGEAQTIHQRFDGRVSVSLGPGGSGTALMKSRVIRNAAELSSFIDTIPKQAIQMKQPAPPSDDPLLAKPAIDFDKHMMLVTFRSDSMYVGPVFRVPRLDGDKLVARVTNPPLGATAMAAAQAGIGTYAAIVIDRHDGEVAFE